MLHMQTHAILFTTPTHPGSEPEGDQTRKQEAPVSPSSHSVELILEPALCLFLISETSPSEEATAKGQGWDHYLEH